MNPQEYERLDEIEKEHWFYRGKRTLVRRWIERYLRLEPQTRLLDVGTGTGRFAAEMSARCTVVGLDDHAESLQIARKRAGPCWVQGAAPLPFQNDCFDAVTALDVIEHIDDDGAAVGELARVTRPGGLIVITVPAFMLLWSRWDEALHHRRRYRRHAVLQLARSAQLEVQTCRYINSLVFVPILAYRWLRERTPLFQGDRAEDRLPPAWINALLYHTFVATALCRPCRLPFGVSVLAVLRKPPA
jgi:ubiquinone/menaquinone biosynthesis C-methylase UbiE